MNSFINYFKKSDFLNNILITIIFMFLADKTILSYFLKVSIDGYLRNIAFKTSLIMLLFSVLIILFSVFYFLRFNRILLTIIAALSISSDYFMRSYGILIDDTVFQSIFETSKTEAMQYYHITFFIETILLTILFSYLISKINYREYNFLNRLKTMFLGFVTSFCIVFLIGLFFYKDYAAFFRNNRDLRHQVNPVNFIYQGYSYLQLIRQNIDRSLIKISEDAQIKKSNRPKIFIFILGETARASSFSLNGYSRPTNPNLVKENNVINFSQTTSCGTATAISVPCLFSDKTRDEFNKKTDLYRENLVDIISKVGFESTWVENNTGCKGVCARIQSYNLTPLKSNKFCNSGGCFDEILLAALDKILDKPKLKNQAIYLHMLGSHGPTYYLRYPPNFSIFKPECNTSKLSDCSHEAIINSYDNTILYTEYVISKIIEKMKKFKDFDSSVLYISDHGESLGENGIYLHSLPYLLAPEEQKHVPFIYWFSDSFQKSKNTQIANSLKNKDCKVSHDNVFHSILDILDISSKHLNKSLSVFNSNLNCNIK